MQAVVYRGVNDLRLETLPVPKIRPGELLLKVAVCGVCPTDIKKIQYGTVPPPRVFGHETAGTIVRVGARVRGFKVGERVALHHHIPCLKCHACRHRAFAQCETYKRTGITAGFEAAGGGYAEYVRVMAFVLPGVVKIPARNSFLEGAMLEPVNTVLKAVNRLALLKGDTVLVAGQGPIGLMFTRLLALRGMKVLATDLMETRLQLAKDFGAHVAWCANGATGKDELISHATLASSPGLSSRGEEKDSRSLLSPALSSASRKRGGNTNANSDSIHDVVERMTDGRGLDAAVIAVPSDDVVREAQQLMRGGGQVLLFSHTRRGVQTAIDMAAICVDEKDLIGSYSADFLLQPEVARLVFSRKMDMRPLITHQFALAETAKAIELASKPTPESLKVAVSTEHVAGW
jgi:L-iditol 2-dehydrogenase